MKKQFTKIETPVNVNGFFHAWSNGYKLDTTDTLHMDFPDHYSETRRDDEIDAFYDGFDNVCEDDHGDLYMVSFDYSTETPVPILWQRIVKVAE